MASGMLEASSGGYLSSIKGGDNEAIERVSYTTELPLLIAK
jgi:hypothetical protein